MGSRPTATKRRTHGLTRTHGAAYKHPGTPVYRDDYVSQLDPLYGPIIDGTVVVHKMGATILRHLQVSQYLRY